MIWLSRVIFLLLLSPGEGHTRKTRSEVVKRNLYPVDPYDIQILSSDQVSRVAVFDGPEWDGTVYRGDARTPPEIKAQDGFHPRPGPDAASKYSIYSHVKGNIKNTGYVSTTSDVNRAGLYARNSLKAPGHEGKTVSYVYQIQANRKNYVGVNKSLRFNNVWSNQEHVAMGGIPWSEVKGYAKLTREQLDSIRVSKAKVEDFVTSYTPNEDFIESALPGSSARPELAGWPEKSTAWLVEPWRRQRARNGGEPPNTKQAFDKIKAACGRLAKRDGPCLGNPSEGERFEGNMSNEDFGRAHGTTDGSKAELDGTEDVVTEEVSENAKPGNGEGEETQPENKGSEGEIGETPPEEAYPERLSEDQLLEESKKFTEEEFGRLTAKFGLNKLFSRPRNPLSFNKVKALLKGYERFSLAPAKIKSKLGKIMPGKGLAVGAIFWVNDMADVFSRNSSAIERAAVMTSLVPLVGCAVQAGANEEKGRPDDFDTSLCVVGDALMFTPAWPLGLAVHGLRMVIKVLPGTIKDTIEYSKWLNEQEVTIRRIKGWRQRRDEILMHFKSNNLTANVRTQYEAEQLAILYSASQAAGGLRAGTIKAATSEERPRFENTTKYAGQEELEQRICDQFYQSKYLIIKDMEDGMLAMMQEQQRQYDDQFFKQLENVMDNYLKFHRVTDHTEIGGLVDLLVSGSRPHSKYISKVRSISYPGKLLPDQERMEFRTFLDEKLEFPPQCGDRESNFRKYPRPDWSEITSEWIDHYCTRDADDLLAKFTQAKAELLKQGGRFAETFDLSTDGCSEPGTSLEDNPSRIANLSFRPACERHDFCYRNFKAEERFHIGEKAVIDEIFQKE